MDRIVQFAPALLAVFAVASGYFASSATIPFIKTYSLAVYIGTILAVAVPGLSLWKRWCVRRAAKRIEQLHRLTPTTLSVQANGLSVTDSHSSLTVKWPLVHSAKVVPHGILLTWGATGMLVPMRAFASEAERQAVANLINENAGAGL